jgi:hypothetical protein
LFVSKQVGLFQWARTQHVRSTYAVLPYREAAAAAAAAAFARLVGKQRQARELIRDEPKHHQE